MPLLLMRCGFTECFDLGGRAVVFDVARRADHSRPCRRAGALLPARKSLPQPSLEGKDSGVFTPDRGDIGAVSGLPEPA